MPSLSAEAQFNYARHCFEANDYRTAIVEFKRFVYLFPNEPRTDRAYYHIGLCFFQLAEYDNALNYFEKTVKAYPDSEFALESRFRISSCYFQMNDPDAAEKTLLKLIQTSEQKEAKDRAFYRLGWLYLETGRIGQARTWFEGISQSGKSAYQVVELKKSMDRMGDLPRKSPVLGGIFSIIPGGGYLYCHRYQDAGVAFFINAALIGVACESFDNGLEILGGIVSLIDLGFYAGSIYGGISSVHKYNRFAYNRFIKDLKDSSVPKKSGLEISFKFQF